MKVTRIEAKLQFMADSEVLENLSPEVVKKIKEKDEHPLFKVFSLGHEGISYPHFAGKLKKLGTVVLNWLCKGVEAIYDKLNLGTKVFAWHNEDNSHEGRTQIGEVVGKFKKAIDNVLHTMGIIYVNPEHRDNDYDICSIETNLNVPQSVSEMKVDYPDVGEITAVALANSKSASPAFPGATLQTALQFLKAENEDDDIEKKKEGDSGKNKNQEKKKEVKKMPDEDKTITLKDVLKFIADNQVYPTNLFSVEEILKAPQIMRKIEADFVPKEKAEKEKRDLISERDELREKLESVNIKETAEKMVTDRKIENEKMRLFIKDNISQFKLEQNGKSLESQLGSWMNSMIERFNRYQPEKEEEGGPKKEEGKGVGPNPKEGEGGEHSYTDPKFNDMIPS